ncbi:MAG: hypothetical protein K6F53_03900 [Lachnospiraceae bacterium]|nr:hypothetical protein [Lachnospiraceae bacterium]
MMLPGDVKTVEDLFAKLIILRYIIDWTSEECLEDEELMRETLTGLETGSYTNGSAKVKSHYRYN